MNLLRRAEWAAIPRPPQAEDGNLPTPSTAFAANGRWGFSYEAERRVRKNLEWPRPLKPKSIREPHRIRGKPTSADPDVSGEAVSREAPQGSRGKEFPLGTHKSPRNLEPHPQISKFLVWTRVQESEF